MKDYYAILDVPPGATPEQIRSRYKLLVRIYHPDRFQAASDKRYAEEKLKAVNEAYEALIAGGARWPNDAPRPLATPAQLHFAELAPGARQVQTVQVTVAGGSTQNLAFSLGGEHDWFAVSKAHRLHADDLFPMEFEVAADASHLETGQLYEGWVDVLADGVATRVLVSGRLADSRSAFSLGPRVALASAACIALIVLFLGSLLSAQRSGPVSASMGLGASNTTTPAVAAVKPISATSSAESSPTAGNQDATAVLSNRQSATSESSPISATPLPVASGQDGAEATPLPTSTLNRAQMQDNSVAPSLEVVRRAVQPVATNQTAGPAERRIRSMQAIVSSVAGLVVRTDAEVAKSAATEAVPTPTAATLSAPPVATQPPTIQVESAPPIPGAIQITVPEAYNVTARATSSLAAPAVSILTFGSTAPAIGRTDDNIWLQIELPDGRPAWVHVEAIIISQAEIELLPIVTAPALSALEDDRTR